MFMSVHKQKALEVIRIWLKGYVASFRYPIFISGLQPTLPVPPLSTIYGILSASAGRQITPKDTPVGYVFSHQGKTIDLETTYELGENLRAKTNITRREILFNPDLFIYVSQEDIAGSFYEPAFPLLLGRSSDLCQVMEIKKVALNYFEPASDEESSSVSLGGTVLPYPEAGYHGTVQALPSYFTDDRPREARGTRLFAILEKPVSWRYGQVWVDEEKAWGVYMHGL